MYKKKICPYLYLCWWGLQLCTAFAQSVDTLSPVFYLLSLAFFVISVVVVHLVFMYSRCKTMRQCSSSSFTFLFQFHSEHSWIDFFSAKKTSFALTGIETYFSILVTYKLSKINWLEESEIVLFNNLIFFPGHTSTPPIKSSSVCTQYQFDFVSTCGCMRLRSKKNTLINYSKMKFK